MACGVIVPRESAAMESCVVTGWYVKKGDAVAAGDPVCGVETGKASFDLEAPEDGTVLDIFFQEGEEAPFLVPVAVIGEPGEDYSELTPKKSAPSDGKQRIRKTEGPHSKSEAQVQEGTRPGEEEHVKEYDISPPGPEQRTEAPQAISPRTGTGRVPASPKARMYAKKRNIPLETVKGTGPGGAVVMRDLLTTR